MDLIVLLCNNFPAHHEHGNNDIVIYGDQFIQMQHEDISVFDYWGVAFTNDDMCNAKYLTLPNNTAPDCRYYVAHMSTKPSNMIINVNNKRYFICYGCMQGIAEVKRITINGQEYTYDSNYIYNGGECVSYRKRDLMYYYRILRCDWCWFCNDHLTSERRSECSAKLALIYRALIRRHSKLYYNTLFIDILVDIRHNIVRLLIAALEIAD